MTQSEKNHEMICYTIFRTTSNLEKSFEFIDKLPFSAELKDSFKDAEVGMARVNFQFAKEMFNISYPELNADQALDISAKLSNAELIINSFENTTTHE